MIVPIGGKRRVCPGPAAGTAIYGHQRALLTSSPRPRFTSSEPVEGPNNPSSMEDQLGPRRRPEPAKNDPPPAHPVAYRAPHHLRPSTTSGRPCPVGTGKGQEERGLPSSHMPNNSCSSEALACPRAGPGAREHPPHPTVVAVDPVSPGPAPRGSAATVAVRHHLLSSTTSDRPFPAGAGKGQEDRGRSSTPNNPFASDGPRAIRPTTPDTDTLDQISLAMWPAHGRGWRWV